MKRSALLAMLWIFSFTPALAATHHHAASDVGGAKKFGLGLELGNPTGITGKLWTDHENAFDVGFAFAVDNYALIYGDYLKHFPKAFGASSPFVAQLNPYVGIGPIFVFGTQSSLFGRATTTFEFGARIPLGISWLPPSVPIEIFAEIVPAVAILPSTVALFQGAIGGRFYF